MSMIAEINLIQNPADRDMMMGFYNDLCDSIVIPNSCLPKQFHNTKQYELGDLSDDADDKRVYGSSITQIHKAIKREAKRNAKKIENAAIRAAKAERIEKYAAAIANGGEIVYDINEEKLYRNQLTFCAARSNAGDLLDETRED